jgi:hypothetical protein
MERIVVNEVLYGALGWKPAGNAINGIVQVKATIERWLDPDGVRRGSESSVINWSWGVTFAATFLRESGLKDRHCLNRFGHG